MESHVVVRVVILSVVLSSVLSGPATGSTQSHPGIESTGSTPTTTTVARDTTSDWSTRLTADEVQSCHNASELNTTAQLLQTFENCTRVSYPNPPGTAGNQTERTFERLFAGNATVSRYPKYARLRDASVIRDAHVSIYGIHPSTRVGTDSNTTTILIAPNGTLRALVDYRLRGPSLVDGSIDSHDVASIRLRYNGTTVDSVSSTQTPVLHYEDLPQGPGTLTVEATIRVRENESTTEANSAVQSETVLTVRDQQRVIVTDVTAADVRIRQARYQTGTVALAVSHLHWQRLAVTTTRTPHQNETATPSTATSRTEIVLERSWRFQTAVDGDWTQLSAATADGVERTHSASAPVYVQAVPIGERDARPFGRAAPHGVLSVNHWRSAVSTEKPMSTERPGREPTQSTHGVTFRFQPNRQPTAIRVFGVVRGTSARVDLREIPVETVRQPNLGVVVHEQTGSTATLRVTLHDARTGEPIRVDRATQASLTIDGMQVPTDIDGEAVVTVDEYGPHAVQFVPGPLVATEGQGVYSSATATATWHPLQTLAGWQTVATSLLSWSVLGLVILYAGRHLGRLLHLRDHL